MTKSEYFNKLHQDLGNKYGMPSEAVLYLRSVVLVNNLNHPQAVEFIRKRIEVRQEALKQAEIHFKSKRHKKFCKSLKCIERISSASDKNIEGIKFRQSIIYWLENCAESMFEDITQKTEYDQK